MIIGGKCSLSKNQLIDRINRGIKFIEFHTEAQDFFNYKKYLYLKDILKSLGATCYCIHTPMENFKNTSISLMSTNINIQNENNLFIKRTMDLVSEISEYSNPIIVIHPSEEFNLLNNSCNLEYIERQKFIFASELYYLSEYARNNYPSIILAIENSPMYIVKEGKPIFSTGGIEPGFVNEVRKLNLSNVGMVLDICHAESVCRFTKVLKKTSTLSIIDYIESYGSDLKMIHLNNLIDFGELKEKHSRPYCLNNQSDVEYLKQIFLKLQEKDYKNPITLEINENDFDNAVNFSATLETVKYITSYLGISIS